jgi:hypothetical protein
MKALIGCMLVISSVLAAAAQSPRTYPASPYFPPTALQPSGTFTSPYGTSSNSNQGQNRGYLNANPYDPNSEYGAGAARAYRPRNLNGTGGIYR